jgi:hypothetical protein
VGNSRKSAAAMSQHAADVTGETAALAALAGLSATQKCQFSGSLSHIRVSFWRKTAKHAQLLHFVHFPVTHFSIYFYLLI